MKLFTAPNLQKGLFTQLLNSVNQLFMWGSNYTSLSFRVFSIANDLKNYFVSKLKFST